MGSAAGLAILVGSVGSVALTLYAGRRNPSLVLRAMFALWVVVPFVTAIVISSRSRWRSAVRAGVFDVVLVILAAFSLGEYAWTVVGPPRPHMASVFLLTPAASLAVLLLTVVIGSWRSGNQSPRPGGQE